MKHLVEMRLSDLEAERSWHPGGVTFSSLLPMRSLPFEVVCLLGMNETEFPRAGSAPAFDLMAAHPRLGDRSQRSDDRHLFLEAVLQARRVLIISAVGQSIRDGSAHPPSVLVRDLLETLVNVYGVERRDLVAEHPLQPFSPRYFGAAAGTALFSYSRTNCEAAAAGISGARAEHGLFPASAEGSREPLVLDIDELCEFFRLPARYLLQKRLGAVFPWREAAILEREPIDAGGPDERRARDWILALLLEGSKENAFDIIRSMGLLPLGRAGAIRFQRLLGECEALALAVRAAREGPSAGPVELDLIVGTDPGLTRLCGTVGDVWQGGRVAYGQRSLNGTAVLGAWIRHLALLAADAMPDMQQTLLLGVKGRREIERLTLGAPSADPMRHLEDLIDIYRLGNEIPLPFMPDISYERAREALARNRRRGPAMDPRAAWERSRYSQDIAVSTAFRGTDPFVWEPLPGVSFDALSLRIFQPVLEALRKPETSP
jgi:exodeoxyribonuclease V gamma subunit